MNNKHLAIFVQAATLSFLSGLAACTAHTVTTFPYKSKYYNIKYSRGGEVAEYFIKAKRFQNSGTKLRILGMCASACTIYTFKQFNLDICAGPNGYFEFHKPYSLNKSGRVDTSQRSKEVYSEVWNRWVDKSYPESISSILRKNYIPSPSHGDSPSRVFRVDADKVYPKCDK